MKIFLGIRDKDILFNVDGEGGREKKTSNNDKNVKGVC